MIRIFDRSFQGALPHPVFWKVPCFQGTEPDTGDNADEAPDAGKPHAGKTHGVDDARAAAEGPPRNVSSRERGTGNDGTHIPFPHEIFVKGLPLFLSCKAEEHGKDEQNAHG